MIRSLKKDLNYYPFEIRKGISESQWLSLKEKIGDNLIIPGDYRNFLFKYNGGSFLECHIKESPVGDLIVDECYPFDDDYSGGLGNIINHSREDLDAGLLPIADDPGGNYFSLGVGV